MQANFSYVFMMVIAHICIIIFALVNQVLSDNVVWLKMTDAAVNTASTDTVMRQPDKVFDLSDLIMKRAQYEIYSVAVHSPGFITSQIEVSRATNGFFNGTWTASSLIVDVTGQASFIGRTFRIDSRVVIKDLSLRLTHRQDDVSLLKLAGCDFTFQIESITMRDSSLQSFVSIWRSQFLALPSRAICYRMGILHRQQPLYLFGIPEDRTNKMAPAAVALKDFALWIAFQRRRTEAGVIGSGSPPDINVDSPTSLTVFFPQGFIADLVNPWIDDILLSKKRKKKNNCASPTPNHIICIEDITLADNISVRIKLGDLAEYFEMGDLILEEKVGFTRSVSLDLHGHDLIINKDRVISTIASTLQFNFSSECGGYNLFSLDWKLDISFKMIYNDQSLFLRGDDIRSEVAVRKSLIGKPKNLSKLMENLQIEDFFEKGLFEDLAFFLGNTAILSNTVLSGGQNYLILRSGTTLRPKVTPWKEFGTGFTGERVKVINNEDLSTEMVEFCENVPRTLSSSDAVNVYQRFWMVMFLATTTFIF